MSEKMIENIAGMEFTLEYPEYDTNGDLSKPGSLIVESKQSKVLLDVFSDEKTKNMIVDSIKAAISGKEPNPDEIQFIQRFTLEQLNIILDFILNIEK